ncbi:MAG: beta-galactosidase, partial [Prevotella sp.]
MRLRHLAIVAALLPLWASAQRHVVDLRQWEFSRDGQGWQMVEVPHDWAISGPFDKKWDLQYVAITQNGETEKSEKSGRSGALPWIGKGFYRTYVDGDGLAGRRVVIAFDGAMAEPH